MRYSTFFKFVAVILCAASLLGMAGSAASLVFLTELGNKTVEERYCEQLQSHAIGYAMDAGGIYASENLGGAHRNLVNVHWGTDWENWYYDWTCVGYTLYDGEGNVLQEQEILDTGREVIFEETIPVNGQYIQVISQTPYEEYFPQATEPAAMDDYEVWVMPSQESTPIRTVYVDYTDGSHEEWPDDGTQLGVLQYTGGNTVTFLSNFGEIPMGDGWYPNHILMLDAGGNAVYEAAADTNLILSSQMDPGYMCSIHLPAGTITVAAPMGVDVTKADVDYKAYDAIPAQGVTVTSMRVTYANKDGEVIGSEGISSPDLIGTMFHTVDMNAEFRSLEEVTLDIPQDCVITEIIFLDSRGSVLFEASCPGGVGRIEYDENGFLIFKGAVPGVEMTEETKAEETEAVKPAESPEERTGFVMEATDLYSAPSVLSQKLGSLEAWEEVRILRQDSFNGEVWGLTAEGWILMDSVLLGETADRSLEALPESAAAREIPEETEPEAIEETVIPEETVPATEPEVLPEAETLPDMAEPAAAETVAEDIPVYPAERIRKTQYYNSELQKEMVTEYVMEPIPEGYTMTIRLAEGALRNELGWTLLRLAETFRGWLLEILGISIAVFALCVVHLSCSAGRTRRNNEVRAGGLNQIPLDLYLVGGGTGIVGLVAAAVIGAEYFAKNDEQLAILCCGACAYLAALLLVGFCFAFVAQVKTPGGFWWRNTLFGRCLRLIVLCCRRVKHWLISGKPVIRAFFGWLGRLINALWIFGKRTAVWLWDTGKRLLAWGVQMFGRFLNWMGGHLVRFFGLFPITWQFLLTGFMLIFLLYVVLRSYKIGWILLGFGVFFAVLLYAASAFGILLDSAKRMSKGDLDIKVDDRMLIGGFKDFADELNALADVAVIAAQKQLKSERMKTELITNVSHDIKTPLTSIINYVDLLQKPHTPEQEHQYLEVLNRQSLRLKKLVDDLMEMSKANTGNMTVEVARMDAAEAVNQALGEFADKLEKAQLTPVFRQPEEPVEILADGRLVWRVMSNLLSNTVKYALPGTRVYVDLLEVDGKVVISMKNISREALNLQDADELMERFVRGDTSRNTEGSGLGLNIARSLMELQKGQLQLLVDGDLFKVTLIFPGV